MATKLCWVKRESNDSRLIGLPRRPTCILCTFTRCHKIGCHGKVPWGIGKNWSGWTKIHANTFHLVKKNRENRSSKFLDISAQITKRRKFAERAKLTTTHTHNTIELLLTNIHSGTFSDELCQCINMAADHLQHHHHHHHQERLQRYAQAYRASHQKPRWRHTVMWLSFT